MEPTESTRFKADGQTQKTHISRTDQVRHSTTAESITNIYIKFKPSRLCEIFLPLLACKDAQSDRYKRFGSD
jgi:hypothetical protein